MHQEVGDKNIMSEMNLVKAPLEIGDLQLYFENKDIKFLIDYEESTLKGEELLVYLSNLELPCDLKIDDDTTMAELGKIYLKFEKIIDIPILEKFIIDALFGHRRILFGNSQYMSLENLLSFVQENEEQLEAWCDKLDSLTLYNLYTIDQEQMKDFVKSHIEDDTDSIRGINFVSILKNENFYYYYNSLDDSKKLKYYSKYFNDYMFAGKGLFDFWAVKENPLFVLSWGLLEDTTVGTE